MYSDEDLFKAVLVSIGMLGVLTEVTFQCEKSFNLREKLTVHPLNYCVENFYQLATRSEHTNTLIVYVYVISGKSAADSRHIPYQAYIDLSVDR